MAMNNGLRSCASKFLSTTESFLPKSVPLPGIQLRGGLVNLCALLLMVSENLALALHKVDFFFFLSNPDMNRGIHSTGVKKMGGGHGHDEPFYLHAKHMYNLDRMKHQQLKMTLGVLTAFTIGVSVPVYAVIFQQKKTSSA